MCSRFQVYRLVTFEHTLFLLVRIVWWHNFGLFFVLTCPIVTDQNFMMWCPLNNVVQQKNFSITVKNSFHTCICNRCHHEIYHQMLMCFWKNFVQRYRSLNYWVHQNRWKVLHSILIYQILVSNWFASTWKHMTLRLVGWKESINFTKKVHIPPISNMIHCMVTYTGINVSKS